MKGEKTHGNMTLISLFWGGATETLLKFGEGGSEGRKITKRKKESNQQMDAWGKGRSTLIIKLQIIQATEKGENCQHVGSSL